MMRTILLITSVILCVGSPVAAVEKSAIDRAVDKGVAALKAAQNPDGSWGSNELGATALVGLALLECGVPPEDRAIKAAAKVIRENSILTGQTYYISLSIMFLDRLNERTDTPLIESLIVRLLAGQSRDGGWSYTCPTPAPEEVRRIQAEMNPPRVLKGGRDLTTLPEKGRRTVNDLPDEIKNQLALITRVPAGAINAQAVLGSDNSNTQFATLALWIGRRYGVPVQEGLLRVGQRFRLSQNRDGGWSYNSILSGLPMGAIAGMGGSTATMTCSGVLGLVCAHGAALDVKRLRDPKVDKQDLSKDNELKAALLLLSTAVGTPLGWNGTGPRPAAISGASGKAYYFLWSLERCAVAMNIDKLGDKDWYRWGAEILLANQTPAGTWEGDYASHGNADTAFALLFLKKANLTRDLAGNLTGIGREGRVLKGGTSVSRIDPALTSAAGIGNRTKSRPASTTPSPTKRPADNGDKPGERPVVEKPRPRADTPAEQAVVRLGDDLLRAKNEEKAAILEKLRDSKGVVYTETLVWVISRLDGDARKQARVSLAERFTRLKDATLREYLQDDEAEIRRAAALASAARGSRGLVPDLIRRLSDPEDLVQRAALTALRELTKQDFGPTAAAGPAERKQAIAAWLKWWKENSRE